MLDLRTAVSQFGADAKAKLANPGATGEPEDQLRAPLERLFADLAEICGFKRDWLAAVWNYEVSGKRVLTQWFSYRKKNRERPIIGDRRPPSKLGDIQPDHWLAEYTTELLNVLHVLALLVEMEPDQVKLMEAICEEVPKFHRPD